jgi:methionyl-tRNA formyltransferase
LNKFGFKPKVITTLNGQKIKNELKSLEPDVFLFCAFDTIAGPKFLEIPSIGTYNVHFGKLPQYKGSVSAFWVLRFNDQTGGASIHKAIPELHSGELFAEIEVPVRENSMNSLMMDTAGEMLKNFIDDLYNGSLKAIDTSKRPNGYYYLPGRKNFKQFYKSNCRLM